MKLLRTLQIGRGENCDIQLQDDTVSRRHARLELLPGARLRLTDLGSSNGTWFKSPQGWQALEALKPLEVDADQPLRFGEHEVQLRKLLERFPAFAVLLEGDVPGPERSGPEVPGLHVADLESLRIKSEPELPRHHKPRRNPGTGDIEDAS